MRGGFPRESFSEGEGRRKKKGKKLTTRSLKICSFLPYGGVLYIERNEHPVTAPVLRRPYKSFALTPRSGLPDFCSGWPPRSQMLTFCIFA